MRVVTKLPAILGFASCMAFAQTGALAPSAPVGTVSGGTPPALQQYAINGVSYVCGGVGLDESQYLRSMAPQHDLALTFATQGGAYLANVTVEIADVNGNLLVDTACAGPIMLVDFPRAGTYHIRAESNGRMLNRTITVAHPQGQAKTVFVWPPDPAEQVATDGMPRGTR